MAVIHLRGRQRASVKSKHHSFVGSEALTEYLGPKGFLSHILLLD